MYGRKRPGSHAHNNTQIINLRKDSSRCDNLFYYKYKFLSSLKKIIQSDYSYLYGCFS